MRHPEHPDLVLRFALLVTGTGAGTIRRLCLSGIDDAASVRSDRLDDLLGFREFAGRLLGVDERVAERDLIDTPTAGDECHVRNLVIVVVEKCFRQTGGFLEVASGGAVFDRE